MKIKVTLSSEFDRFFSLEETIIQICGKLVRIDKSRVLLIHVTARYYFLGEIEERDLFINCHKGHEHIALRCLDFLSDEMWRGFVPRVAALMFLLYGYLLHEVR